MNIQIIGIKSCNDTRKAERYFKERRIPFHFRDLNEKGLAKGELDNIVKKIPMEELIDSDGKEFKKRNMQYMRFDIEEELLNDALLIKMPVVRNGSDVTIGYQPETWKKWIEEAG
ncbi:MAG: ArsC/Spx/MgsR family protein [Bacteroidota bacterium]|jgi:Spx/MgsR family transcriptional regulator